MAPSQHFTRSWRLNKERDDVDTRTLPLDGTASLHPITRSPKVVHFVPCTIDPRHRPTSVSSTPQARNREPNLERCPWQVPSCVVMVWRTPRWVDGYLGFITERSDNLGDLKWCVMNMRRYKSLGNGNLVSHDRHHRCHLLNLFWAQVGSPSYT